MSKRKPDELLHAEKFFAEGFTSRALDILSKFERIDELTPNDRIN